MRLPCRRRFFSGLARHSTFSRWRSLERRCGRRTQVSSGSIDSRLSRGGSALGISGQTSRFSASPSDRSCGRASGDKWLSVGDARIETILPLLGKGAVLLHGARETALHGGGDYDCVAEKADPAWPLRLPGGWRLCQRIRYDVTATYCVLDCDGDVVAVDILDDPHGVGKYRLSTSRPVTPGTRAAYLVCKRLKKGMRGTPEWAAIADVAAGNIDAFSDALRGLFGRRLAADLAEAVAGRVAPGDSVWRRARRARAIALFRRPDRAARLAVLHLRRVAERLAHPTGFYVVVVGPDGAGKSTLAAALPKSCVGLFRRTLSVHWRPGVLPRPGSILGRAPAEASRPHAQPPHGPALSSLLVLYYWLDFTLGGLVRWFPLRWRSGLIVVERGWWDMIVDPARYRLSRSTWLLRTLGRAIPHPDLVLVLDGSPEEIHRRKPELTPEVIASQSSAWATAVPRRSRVAVLTGDEEFAISAARDSIVQALEARALTRFGAGWAAAPSRSRPRWVIPRRRIHAAAGLRVYNPVTVRAQVGWTLARVATSVGAIRLSRRAAPPPARIRALLAPHVPSYGSFAVSASQTHPNRYIALLLDSRGQEVGLAKIALDELGVAQLERERRALELFSPVLPEPLRAPELLDATTGLLLFDAVPWRMRAAPWRLEAPVAKALGVFHRRTGAAHGDCAPWNLLRVADGWVLIDWEDAHEDAQPFHDVFHFLVQSARLLGRPSMRHLHAGVAGNGWIGTALTAYAAGAGRGTFNVGAEFAAYLHSTCHLRGDDDDQLRSAVTEAST
jgi:hypothetical protein